MTETLFVAETKTGCPKKGCNGSVTSIGSGRKPAILGRDIPCPVCGYMDEPKADEQVEIPVVPEEPVELTVGYIQEKVQEARRLTLEKAEKNGEEIIPASEYEAVLMDDAYQYWWAELWAHSADWLEFLLRELEEKKPDGLATAVVDLAQKYENEAEHSEVYSAKQFLRGVASRLRKLVEG